LPCRFFGFDSFEGLQPDPTRDPDHPQFKAGAFASSYDVVQKRIKKYQKRQSITLVKGYFRDTATPDFFVRERIDKIRVCLIDCDLLSSTEDALKYSSKYWQPGTILIFDDYFSYPARQDSQDPLIKLKNEYPELRLANFGSSGINRCSFIVLSPPNS